MLHADPFLYPPTHLLRFSSETRVGQDEYIANTGVHVSQLIMSRNGQFQLAVELIGCNSKGSESTPTTPEDWPVKFTPLIRTSSR